MIPELNIILLSGGSGQRLWPLSNNSRSKQFLKFLNYDGKEESMLQRVWRQLADTELNNSTFIATSSAHVDILQSQLGNEIPLIIEPERRDTFPAIALSVAYLFSVQNKSKDEVVCVLPVDSFVDNDYFVEINKLELVLSESKANLALIGAYPTYPSSKYGYIIPETNYESKPFVKVKKFIEKPSVEEAEQIISIEKGLWNCGVFAFKVEFLLKILKEYGLPTEYQDLLKEYSKLPKVSFDYEVVENTENIVVKPYNGDWKDLGTWNTLTEHMDTNILGKAKLSEECTETHIINELEIPVLSLGLSNIIIACSHDGILVADKAKSPIIKKYLDSLKTRPMFEERRWGWYKVLDYSKYKDIEVLTKKLMIKQGENISYQYHNKRNEIWTIISGEGYFILDNEMTRVKPGDVLKIPIGGMHTIKGLKDLEIIEVQIGSELIEEDINRLAYSWEEIETIIKKSD